MKKYSKIAWFLNLFLTYFLVPFMIIISIISWFYEPSIWFGTGQLSELVSFLSVPFFSKIMWIIIEGVSFVFLFIEFIYLKRILKYWEHSEVFSERTFFNFSKMSKWAFWWALYIPIKNVLMSLVQTLHNPPGQRMISVSINLNDMINIFIVGFLFLLSSMIYEGYLLKKDQDLTI